MQEGRSIFTGDNGLVNVGGPDFFLKQGKKRWRKLLSGCCKTGQQRRCSLFFYGGQKRQRPFGKAEHTQINGKPFRFAFIQRILLQIQQNMAEAPARTHVGKVSGAQPQAEIIPAGKGIQMPDDFIRERRGYVRKGGKRRRRNGSDSIFSGNFFFRQLQQAVAQEGGEILFRNDAAPVAPFKEKTAGCVGKA